MVSFVCVLLIIIEGIILNKQNKVVENYCANNIMSIEIFSKYKNIEKKTQRTKTSNTYELLKIELNEVKCPSENSSTSRINKTKKTNNNKNQKTSTKSKEKENNNLPDYLKKINFGLLIFADRFKNEYQKKSFAKGHLRGPYIVVGKTNTHLLCLKGSGKKDSNKKNYFLLNDNLYLNKDTYFYTGKIELLDEKRNIEELGKISNENINLLAKQLIIAKNKNQTKISNLKLPKITYGDGDIIEKNNELYLIYNKENNILNGFKILEKKEPDNDRKENTIHINNTYYDLKFENLTSFSIDDKDLIIKDTVSKKQLKIILELMKKYYKKASTTSIERGCVIKKDDKLFYIYGEENQDFLTFELPLTITDSAQLLKVITKCFKNENSIPKNSVSKQDIIFKISDSEMEKIKTLRLNYKKNEKDSTKKKKSKALNLPEIVTGAIVKPKNLTDELYIVLYREKNTIEWISIENLQNEIKETEILEVAHIRKVGMISKIELNEINNWLSNKDITIKEDIKSKIKSM